MARSKKKIFHKGVDLFNDLQYIKDSLATITDDVKKKASSLLSDSYSTARKKTSHLRDEADTYLSDRPFKSIGVALITGFVLGYLLHHSDD